MTGWKWVAFMQAPLRRVCAGRGGLPETDCAEEGVGEGDDLVHDGDQGQFRLLAAVAEALVEGGQGRVAADCGACGHVAATLV